MNIKERLALIALCEGLEALCNRLSVERNITINYADLEAGFKGIRTTLEEVTS